MTDPVPPDLTALFDDYLNGQLDEIRTGQLEARLLADVEARHTFVRYVRLHTDLVFELRARQASDRVLSRIEQDLPVAAPVPRWRVSRRAVGLLATAIALLLAVGVGSRLVGPGG